MSMFNSSNDAYLLKLTYRVTEQPFKIPFYAALLRLLYDPDPDTPDQSSSTDASPLGRQILEDYWKGFQAFLDKLAWREIRLCVSTIDVLRPASSLMNVADTFFCASNSSEAHLS